MSNDQNQNTAQTLPAMAKIPRDRLNDYTAESTAIRQGFIKEQTKTAIDHITHSSFDPAMLPGNIENFVGVAQVPIGLAGPLYVHGDHTNGHYYIPMATTEGTLVASYSRGMRLLNACGGARVTIAERVMQRAPVFHFDCAADARAFGAWVADNTSTIAAAAETTTSVGKLRDIQQWCVGPKHFLRFNYETGDAAGQNMAGKATQAACEWIRENYKPSVSYTLSGAIDTDKKHSAMNTLHSRGARVIAEIVIPCDTLQSIMGVTVQQLFKGRNVSNLGGLLAGTANNGMHAANGLAALFIATGQDAANIAESHAGMTYVEMRDNGDLYWSITLPSLIVATYGGGTGLATQKECLDILGCYGADKVGKFIEICAATVLAGELSLASAVLAGDWVDAHDKLGRNRP